MIQNQLKNWKIEKYNYFCKNACYEQSTNELEIITVIPFNLMINSNKLAFKTMMRKLLTFLQAVAISTLIAGCDGTGTETGPEITPEIKFTEDIVTSGISVESAEQSITLSFSTNVAWSATTSADWITISPSSGAAGKNSVKIKVEENTESKQRTATITIKTTDGKCTASIKVTQGKDKIIFEDANFKAYLVANFDTDRDGEISQMEALGIKDINVSTEDIASVSGIEYMTNLETLICRGTFNNGDASGLLTSIDVTHNKKLTSLDVGCNVLTRIDISNNTELTELSFENNNLTTIDAGNNVSLIRINGDSNKLETIILPLSKSLAVLSVRYNKLTSLDVTRNEGLDSLDCEWNTLSELDLSRNTSLVYLNCGVNKLNTLDLSHNTELEELVAYTNQMTMLDVSKCNKIKELDCGSNHLETLDIGRCTELMVLDCEWNGLDELTIPPITSLYKLYCGGNYLKSLDISANTGLRAFDCSGNQIKSLDVSNNTALNDLNCSDNKIETLDISKLTFEYV